MSSWPIHHIHPYHNDLPKKVIDVLDHWACREEDADRNIVPNAWFVDGSIDHLVEVLDEVDAMLYVKGDQIWVTHHNSWGPR